MFFCLKKKYPNTHTIHKVQNDDTAHRVHNTRLNVQPSHFLRKNTTTNVSSGIKSQVPEYNCSGWFIEFLPRPVLQGRRAVVNKPLLGSRSSGRCLKIWEILLTKLRSGWHQEVYSAVMYTLVQSICTESVDNLSF